MAGVADHTRLGWTSLRSRLFFSLLDLSMHSFEHLPLTEFQSPAFTGSRKNAMRAKNINSNCLYKLAMKSAGNPCVIQRSLARLFSPTNGRPAETGFQRFSSIFWSVKATDTMLFRYSQTGIVQPRRNPKR